MTPRLKFITILFGILGIAGLLAAGGFFFFRSLSSVAENQNDAPVLTNVIPPMLSVNGAINGNGFGGLNRNSSSPPVSSSNPTEAEVSSLARSFAERYGSYSSKNAFQNFRDLRLFMTDRLWSASEQLMRSGANSSDEYFGVTSRSLRVEVTSFDPTGGQATALVTLQRRESAGQNEPKLYYQMLTLKLTRGNGAWLVDEGTWGSIF